VERLFVKDDIVHISLTIETWSHAMENLISWDFENLKLSKGLTIKLNTFGHNNCKISKDQDHRGHWFYILVHL